MTYASLVSLAQTTDLILNHDKYYVYVDDKENLKSIREYVIFLISYLEDFAEKANRFEGKIRKIANEAEDIMEHFMSVQIQSRQQRVTLSVVEVEHQEFARQLKKVREEMGFIAGELMDDRPGILPGPVSSSNFAPTGIKDDIVIGLDKDLITIKERLCRESSKLEVISIVGMAGIGKTTLVRNAYHDPLIMERFQIRVWVTVSQHYSAQKMLLGLLDSMKLMEKQALELNNELTVGEVVDKVLERSPGELTIGEMVQKVHKNLKGRRYLIVLDDIWSTDAWDDVRIILPDDNNGSRVVLTTRLSNLAAYADSCSPLHEMQLMDANQSWKLLKHKVFKNGRDCSPKLEKDGREIAQRCGGLPLAIVLVAGILSTQVKSRASWKKITENVTSVVGAPLQEILSLSYMHLPHHLRPCFLFIGGYPEDYEIRISRLIKLWVAEGFLKHLGRYKRSLEEVAEEYLEDLVKRSLVLVTSRKSNGKIKSCSLHDLVREMCVRKAHEQKFLLNAISSIIPLESIIEERRVSFSDSQQLKYLAPAIHTVISFFEDKSYSQHYLSDHSTFLEFVKDFELLRVLDLVKHVSRLPFQVFELFHLRYLAFSQHMDIPAAISKLENLQTLINYPNSRSEELFYLYLPSEIWKMPQLRHFVSHYTFELPDPPEYGSALPLENLRTLSVIINLVCRGTIMQMIPNLKKLGLAYRNNQAYHLHNLVHLRQLEKLKVTGYRDFSWRKQNLAFPSALKKLTLVGGLLPWEKITIIGSLPNLEVLKLRNFACDGDTWETNDGEFPRLKFLLIEKSHLRYWITDSSHLPTLKCLVLYKCQYLNEIPGGIGEIPTLELIEVDDVNQSLVESARQIKEDSQDNGDDTLQVRCIHFDQNASMPQHTETEKSTAGEREYPAFDRFQNPITLPEGWQDQVTSLERWKIEGKLVVGHVLKQPFIIPIVFAVFFFLLPFGQLMLALIRILGLLVISFAFSLILEPLQR